MADGRDRDRDLIPRFGQPGIAVGARILLVLVLTFCCVVHASAAEPDCPPSGPKVVSIFFENDMKLTALYTSSDDDYTAGLHGSVSYAILRDDSRVSMNRVWPFSLLRAGCYSGGFSSGVSIYTPTDILNPELILDDRPYAAWWYVGYALNAYNTGDDGTVRDQQTVEGLFGLVGVGGGLQNFIHRLRHFDEANGWPNQLKKEFGFTFLYHRKQRLGVSHGFLLPWTDADVVWHAGGAIGNVFTHANGGITFRWGPSLGANIGPSDRPVVIEVFPPEGTSPKPQPPSLIPPRQGLPVRTAYAFVRVDSRLVCRSIFLDGSFFRETVHSIPKYPTITDVEAGVVLLVGRVEVTWRFVRRTPEVRGKDAMNYFGSINVSFPLPPWQ